MHDLHAIPNCRQREFSIHAILNCGQREFMHILHPVRICDLRVIQHTCTIYMLFVIAISENPLQIRNSHPHLPAMADRAASLTRKVPRLISNLLIDYGAFRDG